MSYEYTLNTGQATTQLREKFSRVIGIDPSQPMIDAAQQKHKDHGIIFRRGHSENLRDVLEDDSVDLLISEYPTTTPLITAYAQGKDLKTSLGPYFERPGRTILENMLTDVPDPTLMDSVAKVRGGLHRFDRRYFAGESTIMTGHPLPILIVITQGPHYPTHLPPPLPTQIKPVELQLSMRWRDVLGYFRTWSSLQNFHERFPEDLERVDERFPEDLSNDVNTPGDVDISGGDIAVRTWKDLREEAKKSGGKYGVNDLVSVEWPIALLLVKKV
ncbi:hypothetical protein H0H87_010055 [Tephrocybe sp. NHM501043]|nr:hypothetical protein H0H87_010055 [Tephrocybe sp. NHM501043]